MFLLIINMHSVTIHLYNENFHRLLDVVASLSPTFTRITLRPVICQS